MSMSQPITVDEDELLAFNERAARQGHADRLATEETGTRGRYDRYQEEYHEFCKLVFKDDAERPPVTVDRAYNFLFYHAYRPLMPKQKKGEKRTVAPNTFPKWFKHDVYTEAFNRCKDADPSVTDLSTGDKYIGYTHWNNIKSSLLETADSHVKAEMRLDSRIKTLVKTVTARNGMQARARKEEKVTNQMPHWDLMPVIHKLEELFWGKHADKPDWERIACAMRDRWCFNDSMQCIIRAESLWKEELSDMLHYTHQQAGEPSPYEVLVRVLWDGKTNQKAKGKSLLAQCFRHLDPKKCAIGSKAFYLFSRFRCTDEDFDFLDNEWFEVKTAIPLADRGNKKTKNNKKAMKSGTYKKALAAFQKLAGIISGKLCHIGRSCGVIIPQLDGVSDTELCILGNWLGAIGIVFQKHYSAKVPFSAMRSCAGAGKNPGRYHLPRSEIMPPEELLALVWPNIERAKQRLMAEENNQRFVTAHRFLAVMDYLRVVVLQDAAYFMTQCPDRALHAMFQDPLFQSEAFLKHKDDFAREHACKTRPENDPTLKHVQLVSPAIGNSLETIVTRTQGTSAQLSDIGKALAQMGDDNYNQRRELLEAIKMQFRAMEQQYLAPMLQDIAFMARFFRGGVTAATIPNTVSPSVAETTTTLPMETSPMAGAACDWNANRSPNLQEGVVGTSPMIPQAPPVPREMPCWMTREPPRGDTYDSSLEMYFEWIGLLDSTLALRELFSNTEWRKIHCKKSSAEMKRMQRMKCICSFFDRELEKKGLTTVHEGMSTAEDTATGLKEVEEALFENNTSSQSFSWTRYEKAVKKHMSNGNM